MKRRLAKLASAGPRSGVGSRMGFQHLRKSVLCSSWVRTWRTSFGRLANARSVLSITATASNAELHASRRSRWRIDMSMNKHVKSQAGLPSVRTDWLLESEAICDKTSSGAPKTAPRLKRLRKGELLYIGQSDCPKRGYSALAMVSLPKCRSCKSCHVRCHGFLRTRRVSFKQLPTPASSSFSSPITASNSLRTRRRSCFVQRS